MMLGVVTNRVLCHDNFLNRIDEITKAKPDFLFLREKDLTSTQYLSLAQKCKNICLKNGTTLVINSNITEAKTLALSHIHISYEVFMNYNLKQNPFQSISTSVHSLAQACNAEQKGADFLIAGHIYETNCKKDIAPRGTIFLKNICQNTTIPVFAIGGITTDKIKDISSTGAAGICIMSEFMTCLNPYDTVSYYKELLKT